jgi:putative ABC transport system ATP-binding protein
MAMIEVQGLRKVYTMGEEEVVALGGVDLKVERGEHIAVIGPSGSGKSTLMNILGGLDRPSAGTYHFDGEDIDGFDDDHLADFRRRRIGFVFQSFQLLPRLSALQNVELPMIYAGLAPKARRERAAHLLDRVGLGPRKGHRPTQLSGGQQQRVAIARALANNPDLLLADEPTGALDSQTGKDVLKLFGELNVEGLTLMVVTHDHDIAAQARRQVAFKDGVIVQDTATQGLGARVPA